MKSFRFPFGVDYKPHMPRPKGNNETWMQAVHSRWTHRSQQHGRRVRAANLPFRSSVFTKLWMISCSIWLGEVEKRKRRRRCENNWLRLANREGVGRP